MGGDINVNFPRKSEESTYYASNTSTCLLGPGTTAVPPPAPPVAPSAGRVRVANEDVEEEDEGRGSSRRGGVSSVIINTADPAALVKPPIVKDRKLEHDKERRLGVANDLEAVVAVSRVGGGGVG